MYFLRMKSNMKYSLILALLTTVLLFTACKQKPTIVVESKVNSPWTYDNPMEFSFEVSDTTNFNDMILSLNHSSTFSYQNIYVKINTTFPSNEITEDIISLNISDGKGSFLGNCSGKKCQIDLLLQERFRFDQIGQYTISINQNGRDKELEGIFGAELKIYQVQNQPQK